MTQLYDLITSLTMEQAYQWEDKARSDGDRTASAEQEEFARGILGKAGLPTTQHNINEVGHQLECLIDISSETDFDQFEDYDA